MQSTLLVRMHSLKAEAKKAVRVKTPGYGCLIRPRQRWKMLWDWWSALLIIISAIWSPWRLAFWDEISVGWMAAEGIIDTFFLADIVLSFFSVPF